MPVNSTHDYLSNIRVVLVETTHSGNLGACARAMKNMGVTRLYLVNPQSQIDLDALTRSAKAYDLFDKRVVVENLEQAISDCQVVLACSARSRHIPWPVLNANQGAKKIAQAAKEDNQVAVVFGRESSGLTNDELSMCTAHLSIPCNPDFSSLNLSQAVQVVCYEIFQALSLKDTDESSTWGVKWDHPMASQQQLQNMLVHLEEVMLETEFLDPNNPRQLMTRLQRLFLRTAMDETEVNIFRGLLKSIQQKLGNKAKQ